jgi:hypothetical protein
LAFDRGVTRDAAGLPEPLVRGDFNRALVKVAFRYFPRFAEMTEDPVVFFDLEGIPSQDRKHAVIQEDGEVIARYEINERPGMPRSTIDFILPEKGRQRGAMRPTLDAGERILAAEMFAKRAGDVIDSRRRASQFLTEAINQVDLVLRTVPPGFDAVPESAFVNPAGQRVYQQEPGRFRRDRLTAYRDALRDRLAELSGDSNQPPRPETTREIQSYVQAMAAAEVIKQGVTPMLKSFAAGATADALVALRPRAGDYEKVFEPGAVETARAAFEEFWNSNPHLDQVTGGQTELRVFVAPGGMLRGENDLSRNFPSGYPGIASLLRPERVWVAWKFVKPGESSGIAYDGLVWCDDHWVWFPKPYRVLGKKNNP